MTCATATRAGDILGAACPDCGHSNLHHPGPINPALTGCVLCLLLDHMAGAS